jgi:hypothetical protein
MRDRPPTSGPEPRSRTGTGPRAPPRGRGPRRRGGRWVAPDRKRATYHEGDAEAHGSGAGDEASLTGHLGDLLGDHLDGDGVGDHGLAGGHAGGEGGPASAAGGGAKSAARATWEGERFEEEVYVELPVPSPRSGDAAPPCAPSRA